MPDKSKGGTDTQNNILPILIVSNCSIRLTAKIGPSPGETDGMAEDHPEGVKFTFAKIRTLKMDYIDTIPFDPAFELAGNKNKSAYKPVNFVIYKIRTPICVETVG
jgi:hypothetical protein